MLGADQSQPSGSPDGPAIEYNPRTIMHYTPQQAEDKHIDPTSNSNRLSFTPYQLDLLLAIFTEFRYPNRAQKDVIAKLVGITREQVKVWYQNRRRKELVETKCGRFNPNVNPKSRYVPDEVFSAILAQLHSHSSTSSNKPTKRKRKAEPVPQTKPSYQSLAHLPQQYKELRFDMEPGFVPPNKVAPGAELAAKRLTEARRAPKTACTSTRDTSLNDNFFPPNRVAPYEYSAEYLRCMFAFYYPHVARQMSPFSHMGQAGSVFYPMMHTPLPGLLTAASSPVPALGQSTPVSRFEPPNANPGHDCVNAKQGAIETDDFPSMDLIKPKNSNANLNLCTAGRSHSTYSTGLRIQCEPKFNDIPPLSPNELSPILDVIGDVDDAIDPRLRLSVQGLQTSKNMLNQDFHGPPTVPYSSFTWNQTLPTFNTFV